MASVPRILKKWGAYASLRGAANKNTFYWEDLRRQDLDGGFKMYNKCYVEKRISNKCWGLQFGGSGSQEVLARVGPWEPGMDLNVRDRRRAWCCMCSSVFFSFSKSIWERCRSTTYASRMLPTKSPWVQKHFLLGRPEMTRFGRWVQDVKKKLLYLQNFKKKLGSTIRRL